MDWNDVRYFLALARLGSVRAAGASLGVSHSTVARRLQALEEQLAARLFDRSRDGFVLTAVGREVLPTAERIEREMNALERGLVGRDERLAGPVSLTCPDPYLSELLINNLVAFCADYPEIELHITADARPYDLSRREADIAIRALILDASPPEHLIGLKLAPIVLCNYVGAAHAARLDPERQGSAARWLAFEDRRIQEVIVASSSYPTLPLWGCFASSVLMAQAARAGLGLAMLPTYIGDRTPDLQRLHRSDRRHLADLWLLSHPDLRENARLRAARARVTEVFQRHLPLFQGE